MGKDYTQEYYARWNTLRERRREARRAQENHSNFTTFSLVGIAIGAGLGYRTGLLIPAVVAATAAGALLGALLDWKGLLHRKK